MRVSILRKAYILRKKILDSTCITISGNLVNKINPLIGKLRKNLEMNLKIKNALISV